MRNLFPILISSSYTRAGKNTNVWYQSLMFLWSIYATVRSVCLATPIYQVTFANIVRKNKDKDSCNNQVPSVIQETIIKRVTSDPRLFVEISDNRRLSCARQDIYAKL